MPEDDEQARRERAESLRRAIDEAGGARPPGSPREFTEREARKEAERARKRAEDEEDKDEEA